MVAPSEHRDSLQVGVLALLAAMLMVCWIPRLSWGLWLDETFTAWQSDAGFAGVTGAKLENPGQPVLFARIESLFYHPQARNMELLVRIPSILGALLSGFFVYRLAQTLIEPQAGVLALVPFATNPQIIQYACEARPYTLATAACLGCLWGMIRWLKTGERRYALTFSLFLALIPYFHLVYVVFVVVPGYALFLWFSQGKHIHWTQLLLACSLTALLWVPLVPFIRDFRSRGKGLSFLPTPGLPRLLHVLFPSWWIILGFGLGMMLVQFGLRPLKQSTGWIALNLGAMWWITCPLLLFIISVATNQTILIERYLLHTVAAESLLIAVLFSGFPRSIATLCLVVCFVPITTAVGVANFALPDGPNSWRLPLRMVRQLDPAGTAPVLIQAGHPMSNQLDWQHALERRSFLYSQVSVYAVSNSVYPLPFSPDATMRNYLEQLAPATLDRSKIIFYAGRTGDDVEAWLREFFGSRGYSSSICLQQGLSLIMFHKQNRTPDPGTCTEGLMHMQSRQE
jgi:hypothetical protein